jgi:aspartyl-tRNA(Asn)/glutamyl-tRNA(Gln) amidotransferase subunit C
MPVRLTKPDVRYIAELAHLDLTSDEEDLFARQLAEILAYAEQIGAVDTTGVAATSHVVSHATLRADEVRASLPRDEALANAPDPARSAGLFRVPRVIG